jgi:2-keto-4-pentenoate hydratase/2-oxohepta-3-ene-1,7-dioic acid hydratase in catechol pathway
MKFCRFDDNKLGLVEENRVLDVTAATDILPDLRWPLPRGDTFIANLELVTAEMMRLRDGAKEYALSDICLLSPVANPGKIIGAPVNYLLHQVEANNDDEITFGMPVKTVDDLGLFLKAGSALVGPGQGVVSERSDKRTDHEIELALVIGKGGRNISEDQAHSHIAGYCIGLDMTIRGTEDRSLRKSLDSFAVLGPWFVSTDEISDPDNLALELKVNGEVRQKSATSALIYNVARLVSYASSHYTLDPGDVILTGTPEGVGPVIPGDRLDCQIEGIGEMTVMVRGSDA